jgi:hypothetical protein
VENQFGTLVVDTIRPERLLVPTAKDLIDPVAAPDLGSIDVDHYKCYRVKVTKGTPKFEKVLGVEVTDQFTTPFGEPTLFDLKRPIRLCTPVEKNGEPIKREADHLMCYVAVPSKGQPKPVKVSGIFLNNQFAEGQLDAVKAEELCVPSRKTLSGP